MSINFHANQYEQAFAPHRLQNWETPKSAEGKHPRAHAGFTRISANNRGHLLPNVPRDRSSPWGNYVGTWDMPKNIPGNNVLNPTARSEEAWLKGKKAKETSDVVLSGALKKRHTVDPLPIKMDTLEDDPSEKHELEVAGPPVCGTRCPPENTKESQKSWKDPSVQQECLMWPKAKSPACRSPVGFAETPKPMKTMHQIEQRTEAEEDKNQQCLTPA